MLGSALLKFETFIKNVTNYSILSQKIFSISFRWPAGRYCIYKRGPLCPQGLEQGFVIWDDENTDNQDDKGGALPEGEYTEDTKIYFCCSNKGVKDNQIALPFKKPFFLFAYKSINCQKVKNLFSHLSFGAT